MVNRDRFKNAPLESHRRRRQATRDPATDILDIGVGIAVDGIAATFGHCCQITCERIGSAVPGLGRFAMKPSGLREPMPLWVWLAIALMILAGLAYVTGYLMVEDVLKFFSRQG